MEIKFNIRYLKEVLQKHIPDLSSSARSIIKKAIEERLTVNPIKFGKPLRYSLKGLRRLRVSDYRIIYRVETNNSVTIVAIKHRKDIYEDTHP